MENNKSQFPYKFPGKIPGRKIVNINGQKLTLYSLGFMAVTSGKNIHTLRRYEWDRTLPKPILSSKDQRRWYTAEEIATYGDVIRSARGVMSKKASSTELRDLLFAARSRIKGKITYDLKSVQDKLDEDTTEYRAKKTMLMSRRMKRHLNTIERAKVK